MTLHLLRTRDGVPAQPEPALVADEDRRLVIDDTPPDELLDALLAAQRVFVW